jgi:hypothetical protein
MGVRHVDSEGFSGGSAGRHRDGRSFCKSESRPAAGAPEQGAICRAFEASRRDQETIGRKAPLRDEGRPGNEGDLHHSGREHRRSGRNEEGDDGSSHNEEKEQSGFVEEEPQSHIREVVPGDEGPSKEPRPLQCADGRLNTPIAQQDTA